jgi:hypothetical protein
MVCLACSGCADQLEGAILAGAYVITLPQHLRAERAREEERIRQEALRREEYGKRNCPEGFADICWEFDPAEARAALSAPPPWETYKRIVEHLRERPLPLDDQRSLEVHKGVRRGLLREPLTRGQFAAVLADAEQFVPALRAGDGVSAAMLLSGLAQTLLPLRLHLSSPEERQRAGKVAALLVPACERALAELSDAAREARLRLDKHGDAYALARAELCLGSAYEFAAFTAQDPAEKERLRAEALAVYGRIAARVTENYSSLLAALIAASRVAATDEQRLELARHTATALTAALQGVAPGQRAPSGALFLYGGYDPLFSLRVHYFMYDDVQPARFHRPFSLFGSYGTYSLDRETELMQTWLNQAVLALWEDCASAEARHAVVDTLLDLYAAGAPAGHTPKGAVAMLLLELYTRSGDEHWLRAAPGYLRAGGDPLPAGEWKKLAGRARLRRAELVAQLDDPKLCRDAGGLVIRLRDDLITDQQKCAEAREFMARYLLVSERRPSRLGAAYGIERFLWEPVQKP